MKLTDFITESYISANLESEDKDELFEELVEILVRNNPDFNREEILGAIIERESKMSTGVAKNIAIPHGKTNTVNDICGVIGVSKKGIDYDSLDGEPVYLIFLLLAPLDSSGPHIKALQQIAYLMQDRELYKKVVGAPSSSEAYQIIRNEEIRRESEE
ncbi:MAG: PTS sugar transporter subunit IIA [Spirochaetes bacterium]|nr:PTS sugar transporter subunit IIA [Spirochaetota bacterium]